MSDGLVADPEVIIVDGIWHLFFSANNGWCADAGETCMCYDDNGTEVCLLRSVVTFNLARRTR